MVVSTFAWPIRLASLDGERSLDVDAIVDTGAFMTTLPESLLRQVGVEPVGKRQFVIAVDPQEENLIPRELIMY